MTHSVREARLGPRRREGLGSSACGRLQTALTRAGVRKRQSPAA